MAAGDKSQKQRRHGLFSNSLGVVGKKVYGEVRKRPTHELSRDVADFIIAKIAEAFYVDQENGSKAEVAVRDAIQALANDETISKAYADAICRRVREPQLDQLGRVVAPLRNLIVDPDGITNGVEVGVIILPPEDAPPVPPVPPEPVGTDEDE